ncbi:MAG: hypothetical protein ACXVBR_18210 [Flavisolibacter sp.]
MILFSKRQIQYNHWTIHYEIFLTREMLLFKPVLHNSGSSYSFAIFTRNDSEWLLRSDIEKPLAEKLVAEIKNLHIS